MGGINCGQSNNREPHNGRAGFSLQYAFVMKDIFNLNRIFSDINIDVEKVVITEFSNSKKALEYLENIRKNLNYFKECVNDSSMSIKKAELSLEPFFLQKDLKAGFVEPFNENQDLERAHNFWIKNGELPNENQIYSVVLQTLKKEGDLGYLHLLENKLMLIKVLSERLTAEFNADTTTENIKKGVFQLAIRNADNDITALTTSLVTSLHDLFAMTAAYCLTEYTSHTSLTGKNVNYREYALTENYEEIRNKEA